MHLDEHYAALNAEVRLGDYVMLAVTDTGIGMTPEVMERAFEPFFTTKPKGQGTGLSMVCGFAKQSRRHLKIYSELGHGTTVKLYLPRARSNDSQLAAPEAKGEISPTGSETVLLVEGNTEVRRVARQQLEKLGCRVIEAENGRAALDILDSGEPVDFLFTNVVMPGGITGHDLARDALQQRPGLKVLLTTGYATESVRNGHERPQMSAYTCVSARAPGWVTAPSEASPTSWA